MAFVEQGYRSTSANQNTLRMGFIVREAVSVDEAIDETRIWTPETIPPLTGPTDAFRNSKRWLLDVEAEEISDKDASGISATGSYFTTAIYGPLAACPILTWDTSSQTVRIYQSEQVRSITTRDGTGGTDNRADFAGAINVDTTGGTFRVEGADRFEPEGKFNLTWNPPLSMSVGATYMQRANEMVWHVNSEVFFSAFFEHELLMTGIQGRPIDQRLGRWEVTMSFAYRKNRDDVVIDGITVPDIRGWDYVDPQRELVVGALDSASGGKTSFVKPKINQITVHQLYPEADFNDLFYAATTTGSPLLVEGCSGFETVPATHA
jgi:hypothetical protein